MAKYEEVKAITEDRGLKVGDLCIRADIPPRDLYGVCLVHSKWEVISLKDPTVKWIFKSFYDINSAFIKAPVGTKVTLTQED